MRMLALIVLLSPLALSAEDAYLTYVKNAPEFRRVRQDPAMMTARWDTWIYMPWRYQWHIGTGDAGGQFCRDYGFNGGFVDHGDTGPLPWMEKWNLRFYNDHTAAKGYLYLHRTNWKRAQTDPRAIRFGAQGPRPLDPAMLAKLKGIVTQKVNALKASPMRAAYALDDEVSWGSFVKPIPWRIHADDADYQEWLDSYTGDLDSTPKFVTPEHCRSQLGRALAAIDFSPFLDRMTYNDSYWANFLGALVETANAADPDTPCGFVGGQSPNLWGGYDYAKLMKKVQFIESYNIGSSQAVIRSFNPGNALPQVTTHFHNDTRGTVNDIWQTWYYLAHGNRGMIGWVEGWFDGKTPRKWLDEYKATMKEAARQGAKVVGARWVHDGVAVYYSHPS
ncbi:beta-galactosidase, partial [bacterium]|nr:beta-galactosidase [bacterium]